MPIITLGIKKLIESNALGFCTVDKAGRPHSIAVAYVIVVDDNVIITNTHIEESIENLKDNNQVSLVVWNSEWEEVCVGFELKGVAKNYESGKWFDLVKNLPDNKGYDVRSAIVVSVAEIKKLFS